MRLVIAVVLGVLVRTVVRFRRLPANRPATSGGGVRQRGDQRGDVGAVMIGANDLFAMRASRLAAGRTTTLESYAANLTSIVRELRPTGARIALMSVQVLGERLDAPENVDMDRVNAVVRRVAAAEGVAYLPFNERLKELVRGGDRPFRDSPAPVLVAALLHLGLGIGLDRIGRWHGVRVHTEGLHLAGAGGSAAADLVAEFLTVGSPS